MLNLINHNKLENKDLKYVNKHLDHPWWLQPKVLSLT